MEIEDREYSDNLVVKADSFTVLCLSNYLDSVAFCFLLTFVNVLK